MLRDATAVQLAHHMERHGKWKKAASELQSKVYELGQSLDEEKKLRAEVALLTWCCVTILASWWVCWHPVRPPLSFDRGDSSLNAADFRKAILGRRAGRISLGGLLPILFNLPIFKMYR